MAKQLKNVNHVAKVVKPRKSHGPKDKNGQSHGQNK